jgi:hypothetical protein
MRRPTKAPDYFFAGLGAPDFADFAAGEERFAERFAPQ